MSDHDSLQKRTSREHDGVVSKIKNYIRDVRTEMGAVTWPSFRQVYTTTAVVIVFVFAMAVYLQLVDSVVDAVRNRLFQFFIGGQK